MKEWADLSTVDATHDAHDRVRWHSIAVKPQLGDGTWKKKTRQGSERGCTGGDVSSPPPPFFLLVYIPRCAWLLFHRLRTLSTFRSAVRPSMPPPLLPVWWRRITSTAWWYLAAVTDSGMASWWVSRAEPLLWRHRPVALQMLMVESRWTLGIRRGPLTPECPASAHGPAVVVSTWSSYVTLLYP